MGKTYIADKETLDKCYAILSADGIYGFIEHMDVLSPTARIEYIGQNKDFTPISLNKDTGAMTLNSWADFPIIVANKPWMVRADGTPDYRLDENDYTKKEDGTASDVSNTSYNGGAFSWLARIYKQEYMLGNDRVVKFSMRERDGFEPVGFKDPSNNVLEGVWIPMFYGSILGADTSTPKMVSLAGLQPCYNNTTDKEHTAIANFSSRAAFLGGGIVQTITDLLIMFAKSTNSQEAYGYGNSSGYDASLAPTNGVKQNAVVGGGQFYGTKDAKSLNKIFHSIVLGTYQQWMRDPYTLLVNGRYKVSKNYTYDVTGAKYQDTGTASRRCSIAMAVRRNTVFSIRTSTRPFPASEQSRFIRAREAHPLAVVTDCGRMSRLWRSPFGSVIATTVRLLVCATWLWATLPGMPTGTSGPPSFFYHLSGSQRKQDTVIGGLGVCVSRIPPVEQNRILIA